SFGCLSFRTRTCLTCRDEAAPQERLVMSILKGSDLSGRTALIVGGGSPGGIGFATGEAMAAAGARIALADLATSEVKATAKGLPSQGGHAAFTVDVTDPQSVS